MDWINDHFGALIIGYLVILAFLWCLFRAGRTKDEPEDEFDFDEFDRQMKLDVESLNRWNGSRS
ncbi:hypothetical protein [Allorhizobium ampelinum]|uniref:hypothetical protein n=1 Tax=Allorhizobium ampelinum TaxID=3025782 RepID=UPI000B3FC384|nr:hypothetical protein [Allorhizobium ampelinum]NTA27433.1 hypothetical protein [Allorhizobium ampelinum]OVE94490.1 hypothetical protein B7W85_13135 [Allorhizobium ampelinum]